jgi:hypothetical protein
MSDASDLPDNTPYTCRKCKTTFVPDMFNDFYPDEGGDGKTGLCERCMMAEAFAPKPVPEDKVNTLCRFQQGKATCAFLMFGGGFFCAKGSGHNNTIIDRWRKRQMSADGNYCWGPESGYKLMTPEELEQHRNG